MSIRPKIPPRNLTEYSLSDLEQLMVDLGEPTYRAKQIYQWIFQKGARSIEAMTNLPARLRARLSDDGYCVGRVEIGRLAESIDGTMKLSIRLDDGAAVETVLIPMGDEKFTQCISSQVGCALDCQFCYTGTLGLSRHLSPGEIVDQVIVGRQALGDRGRISHLVYMGMGEPLHNLDGVLTSLDFICDDKGVGFTHRRVTVSTSGLVPGIQKLGAAVPVNLAISLNASNDAIRDEIMPVNRRYNLAALTKALREYPLPPRRKMTMEYVLLGGLNDRDEHAHELTRLLKGLPVRINLIPWNPFQGPKYERPDEASVERFQKILKRHGYTVTVRTTKGLDIDAACGQLGERPTVQS
ncbi:MAG: 23S rRNA (adenine(2503)-C(2))-methyltransferase RlmN [Myxococcota bacterium]|nr:23S rRNA (adenine(2503)-C(2))-methyltransferase RlmN [Myxococcota bacterium]